MPRATMKLCARSFEDEENLLSARLNSLRCCRVNCRHCGCTAVPSNCWSLTLLKDLLDCRFAFASVFRSASRTRASQDNAIFMWEVEARLTEQPLSDHRLLTIMANSASGKPAYQFTWLIQALEMWKRAFRSLIGRSEPGEPNGNTSACGSIN